MNFHIPEECMEKLRNWLKRKKVIYTGAIGGRFSYNFCPTNLGMVITVKDEVDGDEVDISDYEGW